MWNPIEAYLFKFCPKHVGITYKISPGIVPVPGFLCYLFLGIGFICIYLYQCLQHFRYTKNHNVFYWSFLINKIF